MDCFQKIEDHLERGETELALKELKALISNSKMLCKKARPNYLQDCIQLLGWHTDWKKNKLNNLISTEFVSQEKNRINASVSSLYYEIKDRCFSKSLVKPSTLGIFSILEPDTPNSSIDVSNSTAEIGLTLNKDFNSFSEEDKEKIKSAIASLLSIKDQDVIIRKIKPGSVKMEIELPGRKLKDLFIALQNGALTEFNITEFGPLPLRTQRQLSQEDNELTQLWQTFQETQDNVALGKLYEYFQPKLISIAMRYLKDRESAKDVVQDTFVKTISRLEHIEGNVSAYLATAVKNISLNLISREKQQLKLLENHNPDEINRFFTRISDAQDFVQEGKVLRHMAQRLTELQIQVLQMTRRRLQKQRQLRRRLVSLWRTYAISDIRPGKS